MRGLLEMKVDAEKEKGLDEDLLRSHDAGCPQVGSGGRHSESFYDDLRECQWCLAKRPEGLDGE